MKVNGSVTINSMFVERGESGNITLYGSYYDKNRGLLVVFRSTKNMERIPQELYGKEYNHEHIIKKLNERPTHNFIGNLSGPISMPFDTGKVIFID